MTNSDLMTLRPNNMRLWVDALRSDEFRQATGHLKNKDGYCCLGVACEIALRNGVELTVTDHDNGLRVYDGESTCLPESVRDWLGINLNVPHVYDKKFHSGDSTSVVKMNDTLLNTFAEIADALEETYLTEVTV